MQKRMVLQIMEAFCTSLSWKVETISGLILIHFHLDKLIGYHYLRVAFLSKQHMLNSLLNIHHSKQADLSRLRKWDLIYFIFPSRFYFIFDLFFHFLFLEQLGLGLICHTVTAIT